MLGPRDSTGDLLGRSRGPWRTLGVGSVVGVLLAAMSYAVTYAWMADRAVPILSRYADQYSIARAVLPEYAAAIPPWKAVAWLFYNAHRGGVRFSLVGPGQTGSNYVDYLGAAGGAVAWLWLVPATVLVIGGAAVAVRVGARTVRAGVLAGASVAVGYAGALFVVEPLLVVEVATWEIGTGATLSGVIGIPVVCGGVGGAVAASRHTRSAGTSSGG